MPYIYYRPGKDRGSSAIDLFDSNCICLYYLEIYFMRTQVVWLSLDYVNVDT